MAEGCMKKQQNGRYAVDGDELTCGRAVEVKIGGNWVAMRIEHDGADYYLLADGLSFYPKRVHARC